MNPYYLEMANRIADKRALPDVLSLAFDKQIALIKHPSNKKLLFCTRRSAKSYTAGLYLMQEALKNPRCNCLFIGLTRLSAKNIIWKDILHDINNRLNVGAIANKSDLTFTLPNGSVIAITGADADEQEMKKLLGGKYRLVCIDEASMYSINMRNLVYGVLGPALADPGKDGRSGTICLMGTASDFPRGLFYDITVGAEKGWELFQWTAFDNPHMSGKWKETLDEIARDRPLYMQTPQFKQWYQNQWVIDDEKMVYRFDQSRNLHAHGSIRPNSAWTFVLGVDTGWEDDSAFVLTAYSQNDPTLFVVSSFHKKKMSFDDVVKKIQEYMADPVMAPHKIIIDGANKQGVESMRLRSAIPFEYADKQDKATFIELLNSDLIQEKIKIIDVPENRDLWQEMSALVWLTDGDKIKYPKKEHPSLPNHLCDSFLYAWRCGFHYAFASAEQKVVIGSNDWYQKIHENVWDKEREAMSNKDWDEMQPFGELL